MKKEVLLPDIGNFKDVDVIEILVSIGQQVQRDSGLIVLESDKATMEVPSPDSGIVTNIAVKVGDKVSQGALLLIIDVATAENLQAPQKIVTTNENTAIKTATKREQTAAIDLLESNKSINKIQNTTPSIIYASPSIRRLARELGVDLNLVRGSGNKGRITHDDVRNYVKNALTIHTEKSPRSDSFATKIPELPLIDYSAFGEIHSRPLSRIQRISGANLYRNAITIPHVTQFDDADITDLEAFRNNLNLKQQNTVDTPKLTLLPFIMKAVVAVLKRYPEFNSSLDNHGENLILKNYFNIGIAVDTNQGLVVPVIKSVDRKGIQELASELTIISEKARSRKLTPDDMQGGCFSISNLGGVGGSYFTPIINAPEVAILGVSRAVMKPIWQDNAFIPRLMLPLSLSYDHRVIDGASGARFITYLVELLQDIRKLLF